MPRRRPRLRIRVRSRIWQQLTAIVLACALPLTIATALLAAENNRRIAFTRSELRGLAYLTPLTGLLTDVSLHRSLHRQVRAGERTLADRQLLDARIDAGFAELVGTDAALGGEPRTPPPGPPPGPPVGEGGPGGLGGRRRAGRGG